MLSYIVIKGAKFYAFCRSIGFEEIISNVKMSIVKAIVIKVIVRSVENKCYPSSTNTHSSAFVIVQRVLKIRMGYNITFLLVSIKVVSYETQSIVDQWLNFSFIIDTPNNNISKEIYIAGN